MRPWTRAFRRNRGRRPDDSPAPTLSLRDERILLTLAVHTQQLDDRLARLEDLVAATIRDAATQPDQRDLLELRLHSARLAAEISRVTVELRAEIDELRSDDDGGTGTGTSTSTSTETDPDVVDLRSLPRAPEPARPTQLPPARTRGSGWRPAGPG